MQNNNQERQIQNLNDENHMMSEERRMGTPLISSRYMLKMLKQY